MIFRMTPEDLAKPACDLDNFATSLDAFGLPLARRYSFSIRMGF